ncbi:MAG TPA: pyridoxal-phosphate dependent enzyme [Thermoanaerobaculia bacterium]|nr:pyridoxal-phosphate dependent enzyme [Thermoanaerobaculia bacterium]
MTPDVPGALQAIAGVLPRTPVLRSEALDSLAGASLWFKAEGLQVTGSFKVRGAWNRVSSFNSEELAPGLITVSAGNAALGAAWAARAAEARLVVVMPENAVPEKLAAVAAMGARIEKEGVTNATQAFERLARLRAEHGYTLIHPFDDPFVIAGAATATWELLEDVPDLDAVVVPTSGGGLFAGAILAARTAKVHGIQPFGADGLIRSLAAGEPTSPERIQTVADGLTAPKPGALNFKLIREAVEQGRADAAAVSDEAILEAMGLIIRHLRVIVEPAAAAGLAGILAGDRFRGKRVGVVLSGSNAGMDRVRAVLAS